MSKKFIPGDVVTISVKGLAYSQDGFAMGGTVSENSILLFEQISLETYPSFSDFIGKTTIAQDGDTATIIDYVGRPTRISRDPVWFSYDVYEILIKNTVRQVFKQNIKLTKCKKMI